MTKRLLYSSAFAALTVWLGFFARRSDFGPFIGAYGLLFGLYALLVFKEKPGGADLRWYLGLGIALRIALLFSLPNLSDDYYRFLWDGRLLAQGIHPFAHPPEYYMARPELPAGLSRDLYNHLNSPQYYTVYPLVCQAVFALAGWLFPFSDRGAVLIIKLFLLACEIATIAGFGSRPLLRGSGGEGLLSAAGPSWGDRVGEASLLYALNPLILLEIVGNLHFEGAMICFLLAGLNALHRRRLAAGAVWWALATASKLLPPLFLPVLWRWLGWRRGLKFALLFGAISIGMFLPLLQPEVLGNMGSSLRLYFRQFEFNASVYYLAKFWANRYSDWETGRLVGPALGALTLLAVVALAVWRTPKGGKQVRLYEALTLASAIYLFDATTVHPWYVSVPLALSLGTRWRFAIVWSGLAALSYSHYQGGFYQEKWGLIGLEYGVVWVVLIADLCCVSPWNFLRRSNLPCF
ncbi:MAG TPA: hypothetical protein PKL15_06430 [Saprospiraceae bacterium]|nr:hypothetical protein [Saprospiraceae bacterium]